MGEIQSAEEFANLIWRCKETIEENDKDLAFDIRARDKAIVERMGSAFSAWLNDATECHCSQCLPACVRRVSYDVLRELGGE